MADVEWVKISTDIFTKNRKIKLIEKAAGGDTVIVIWFKLIVLAGNVNDGGAIYVTEDVPYDLESLSEELGRKVTVVEKALEVFKKYGMIEVDGDGFIYLCSWEKYQNVEGMEKIREQERLRKRRQREKKKAGDMSRDSHGTVTVCHATEREEDREEDITLSQSAHAHARGKFQNVVLSEEQMRRLAAEYPSDYEAKIERLSIYMAKTGKTYESHYAVLCEWLEQDKEKPSNSGNGKEKTGELQGSFDTDEFFCAAVERSMREIETAVTGRTTQKSE